MRLILIRHGDPDYVRDSLTEKGWREAALLARRVRGWQVDDVYVSPLGRAQATAKPCLEVWHKQATVLPWAEEFAHSYEDENGTRGIVWDYFPADWTGEDLFFRENEWTKQRYTGAIAGDYERVCASLDELIRGYGYEREGRMYRAVSPSEKTVVIFCHFGVSMIFLSHLLNLPALALLHGVYLAPTSVTVLNTEERRGDEAYFRAERIGDTAHLIAGGEPVSRSGYFTDCLQEPDFFKE